MLHTNDLPTLLFFPAQVRLVECVDPVGSSGQALFQKIVDSSVVEVCGCFAFSPCHVIYSCCAQVKWKVQICDDDTGKWSEVRCTAEANEIGDAKWYSLQDANGMHGLFAGNRSTIHRSNQFA